MADPFAPTSPPPTSPPPPLPEKLQQDKEAATAAAEKEQKEKVTTTFTIPSPKTVSPPKPPDQEQVIGEPPTPHMAEPEKPDLSMTDATLDEMEAGKKAADVYARRRQAELDYGKNFVSKRKERITGVKII